MPKQVISLPGFNPYSKKPLYRPSQTRLQSKRDNKWLLSRLDYIWTSFFSDIAQENPVFIKFGRYSKFRLGSIKYSSRRKDSLITITGMFKDPKIPFEVIDHTIAHELCHYTHGFSSPKKQLHKYPHSGGVIKRELEDRDLHHLVRAYRTWVRDYRNKLRRERGWT